MKWFRNLWNILPCSRKVLCWVNFALSLHSLVCISFVLIFANNFWIYGLLNHYFLFSLPFLSPTFLWFCFILLNVLVDASSLTVLLIGEHSRLVCKVLPGTSSKGNAGPSAVPPHHAAGCALGAGARAGVVQCLHGRRFGSLASPDQGFSLVVFSVLTGHTYKAAEGWVETVRSLAQNYLRSREHTATCLLHQWGPLTQAEGRGGVHVFSCSRGMLSVMVGHPAPLALYPWPTEHKIVLVLRYGFFSKEVSSATAWFDLFWQVCQYWKTWGKWFIKSSLCAAMFLRKLLPDVLTACNAERSFSEM